MTQKSYASHIMGADLTYECLGGGRYMLTLKLYRDCRGVSVLSTTPVSYKSVQCGVNSTVSLQMVQGFPKDITPSCTGQKSICSGGSLPYGVEEYAYQGIVTLPEGCGNDWVLGWSDCCRNNAINTLSSPSSAAIYVSTTIDNTLVPCNSSPIFSMPPVPFTCANQLVNFNPGGTDIDGDSLAFSFVIPKNSATSDVTYTSPYSVSNPLATTGGTSIDPANGDINFTPNQVQVGVLAVQVKEYRNGNLISTIVRDIQYTIINCSNQNPTLSGINGTSNNIITIEAGQDTCFSVLSNDSDAGDNLTMTWSQNIQGATFTSNGSKHPTGTFCWQTTPFDTGRHIFTVVVEDDNCPLKGQTTRSYVINVLPCSAPPANAGLDVVLCPGGSTTLAGSTTAPASDVQSYSWTDGVNTHNGQSWTVSPTQKTTYTLLITYVDGCIKAKNVVVDISTLAVDSSITHVGCFGGSNGAIDMTITGNGGPWTFAWSNGSTSKDLQNIPAGCYTLTISDVSGCTVVTKPICVKEPPSLVVKDSVANVKCFGGNDACIYLNVSGGAPAYLYNWSNGANTQSNCNLAAGNYDVTVTDAKTCSVVIQNIKVNEPPFLNAIVTLTNVSCNGFSDGKIKATANGGTPNYNYTWNPANANRDSISGLQAGTYDFTITDANNCTTAIQGLNITEPTPLTVATVTDSATCKGFSDGSITASASGGTPVYSYQWSITNANTNVASGLSAGLYALTVTDKNLCTATAQNIEVGEPTQLVLSAVADSATCKGFSDGSITATASGGTPNYNYTWNPANINSSDISGLNVGTYYLTVTDANNCTATIQNIEVKEPTQLVVDTEVEHISCNGSTDGKITLSTSGSIPNYSYTWNPANVDNNAITSLAPGMYNVTVADANNCTVVIQNIEVKEPAPLSLHTSTTPAICKGSSDGTIKAMATGGTSAYSYQWSSNNTNSDSIGGLKTGLYDLTVTDAHACTISEQNIFVNELPEIILKASVVDVPCPEAEIGAIYLTHTGTYPPEQYSWSNGDTTKDITALALGIYSVTVTDERNCTASIMAEVLNKDLFKIYATPRNTVIDLGQKVKIEVNNSAGTEVASYLYEPDDYLNCADCASAISFPERDVSYTIFAIDTNGCPASDEVNIKVNPVHPVYIPNAFSPGSSEERNPYFEIFGNKEAWKRMHIQIFNRWGVQVYDSRDKFFRWDGVFKGKYLPADVYVYTLNITWIDDYSSSDFRGSITILR